MSTTESPQPVDWVRLRQRPGEYRRGGSCGKAPAGKEAFCEVGAYSVACARVMLDRPARQVAAHHTVTLRVTCCRSAAA